MHSGGNVYEKRAVSLGGYGSVVPYHGFSGLDPAKPGPARFIPIPTEQTVTADSVLDTLEAVAENLDARLNQGQLFYSFLCQDYGLHASGVEQLEEDLRNAFELGEQLGATLEERFNRELDSHRPCFTILTSVEYGLFYMLLRGAKRYTSEDKSEWENVYYVKSGVLVDNPVTSWPNLEKVIDTGGAPIVQEATDLETARAEVEKQTLKEVYPLEQSADRGDADIIGAKNPFGKQAVDGRYGDIGEAFEKTSHLTYRVNGGTVGFENEAEYRIQSVTAYKPEEITLWGHPLVFVSPMCEAVRAE